MNKKEKLLFYKLKNEVKEWNEINPITPGDIHLDYELFGEIKIENKNWLFKICDREKFTFYAEHASIKGIFDQYLRWWINSELTPYQKLLIRKFDLDPIELFLLKEK